MLNKELLAQPEECYCDRMKIGVPGVSCGDCPRDYTPPAIDGFGGNLDEAFDVPSNQLSGNSGALTLIPPAGMVMVPREPTQAMIQAAAEAWDATPGMWDAFQAAIKAGVAAAPAPAMPRPDEFTCPYCFDQGAAPAVREPQPLTDVQKQRIHDETGAGHALICLVESYINGIGGGGK